MNKENNKITRSNFVRTIGWLEKYIEKTNYYSDWEQRKQVLINSIERPDIDSLDPTKMKIELKSIFITALYAFKISLENKNSFLKEELKKKFFQWIDAVKIKADSCPTELIPLLWHTHEVLEGRGSEMEEQNDRDVDRRLSQMSKEEREKGWRDFYSILMEQWQKERQTKEYEFNPKGSAEQGQASFKKIVATISNYDLFPENEIAPDNSPEAQAAIKELEGLLEKKWTTDIEAGENINQTVLKLLEKNIQDLEAFESNTTANGGKNKYAWVKLGAGGKLMDLKMKKLNCEGKLFPPKTSPQTSSDSSSTPFLTIAVISLIFISLLGIVVYLERRKSKKKKKKMEP